MPEETNTRLTLLSRLFTAGLASPPTSRLYELMFGHNSGMTVIQIQWRSVRMTKGCVPSAIPSKIPAKKCSASLEMNLVSCHFASALPPALISSSDNAKTFLPCLSWIDTWICLRNNQ